MNWNDFFEYKNGELYWKVKPLGKVQIGDRLGCVAEGYVKCKFKQKQYSVHRIIYEMHYGQIPPGYLIDHIDGNGLNNDINNLRIVTPEQNVRNTARQKRNKSGYPGVRWDKKRKKWFTHITLKNKMYNLGRYKTLKEAIRVRKKAEKLNGFHINHGRRALR